MKFISVEEACHILHEDQYWPHPETIHYPIEVFYNLDKKSVGRCNIRHIRRLRWNSRPPDEQMVVVNFEDSEYNGYINLNIHSALENIKVELIQQLKALEI